MQSKDMLHHIKELVVTLVPAGAGVQITLETANIGVKILIGVATLVWMGYRIAIARIELKKKEGE